jgi:hypothetical protein
MTRQLQLSKSGINIFYSGGDINFQSGWGGGGFSDRSAGTLGPPGILLATFYKLSSHGSHRADDYLLV